MDYSAQRWIPANANKLANKSGSAVAYVYTTMGGKLGAVGYIGKAKKPALYYTYRDAGRRNVSVMQFLKGAEENAQYVAKQKAEKAAKLSQPQEFLKVGDVLSASWGYDQTNIDYYQVKALVGKRMVEIQEIVSETQDTGWMQGKCVPAVGSFAKDSKPMRKLVDEFGGVRIASYARATKVDQVMVSGVAVGYKPSSWTAYA